MKLVPIIVLSDGETWSLAEDASLLRVTESQGADLQNGGRVQDTRPAAEMTLFPWGEPITPRTASYPMGAAPRPEGGAP